MIQDQIEQPEQPEQIEQPQQIVPPLSNVYKVKHLVNNRVKTIYIFNGASKDKELTHFFSLQEIESIQQENIKVVFSTQQIHLDDTIGIIKIKVLNELRDKISLEEIYLFCQKLEILNSC